MWEHEARLGREEGIKDRPCAIVLVVLREGQNPIVRVLPITHSAPSDPRDGLEIPLPTKLRLGLDVERSWVVISEANDFIWPGPDLRPATPGDLSSVVYGMLPPRFMKELRERLLTRWRIQRAAVTKRTE